MAKRLLLEVRPEPAWVTLFGISCHLKDYRLSYLVNEQFRFCLAKLEDVPLVPDGQKEPSLFPLFRHRDEDQRDTYYLIGNRNPEHILLPAFRQADFLLLVDGPFKKKQKDDLLAGLRRIPNILTAFEIPMASVKNPENLLTDLELHIDRLSPHPAKRFTPPR